MKETSLSENELLELLSRHCTGGLNEEDARRLSDALRADAAARKIYIQYVDLHSWLAWETSSAADLDALLPGPAGGRAATSSRRANPQGRDVGRGALRFFVATRLRVALTVASCFLAVLLGMLAFTPAPRFRFAGSLPEDGASDRILAARITGSIDCVWQETSLPLGYGSSLYKGQQVELLEGAAEITFESGAVVTLRGPAVYVVDSNSSSSLRRGELTAVVPEAARGFAVQTPGASIVDLGTEFGVIVDQGEGEQASPVEEVHVFSGAIELSLRQSHLSPRRLTTNDAVRIRGGRVEALAASRRDRFPHPIDDEGDTTTVEPLPPDQHPPVTRGLTLWLAADGAVRRDASGRVKVWEDMLTGENAKAQNATQRLAGHRPLLVPRAINGKPALRFDGGDVLLLATPSNLMLMQRPYEMFIVARSASPAIQFLIGGGVEDFEIHLNGDAGARFIPAGFDTPADAADTGAPGAFSDGRAHIFSARVEAGGNYAGLLAVDGQASDDVIERDSRSANNTSLRLGMRHDGTYGLQGEIAEVLVYADGLSDEQRRQIENYLADKYGIRTTH